MSDQWLNDGLANFIKRYVLETIKNDVILNLQKMDSI